MNKTKKKTLKMKKEREEVKKKTEKKIGQKIPIEKKRK